MIDIVGMKDVIILNNKENKYKSNRLRHIRLTNMYFVDFMEAFKILTFKSPINNIVRHADGFNLIFVHHILPYMYECDENIMKKNRSNAMNRLTYCKRNSSPSKTWIKNIDRAIEISEAYTYMCLYSSVILNRGSIINSAPSHE